MTEADIDDVVRACESYWRASGVPPTDVADMVTELRSHLHDAAGEGRALDEVVGTDLSGFAEEWARAYRGPVPPRAPEPEPVRRSGAPTLIAVGIIVAAFLAVAILAPKEQTMDVESWRWVWIAAAVVLAVGEMLTAGFFLLPFAVGAAAAAILAFLGVHPIVQLVTFVVVSVLFLVILQRLARHDVTQPNIDAGASRYVGSNAVVIDPVDRLTANGLVRVQTEEWRATTDLPITIPAGSEVRIVAVRGTRLVVEPLRPTTD